jgi:hypothetical protein
MVLLCIELIESYPLGKDHCLFISNLVIFVCRDWTVPASLLRLEILV